MIATNELLLKVIELAKVDAARPPTYIRNNEDYIQNPYRLPNEVSTSVTVLLRDICFELIQGQLNNSTFQKQAGTIRDLMIANAMWGLHRMWSTFKVELSNDPIAFFNAVIVSSFVNTILSERL